MRVIQLYIWECGVRFRCVVQVRVEGLARSQTLPSVMVLAMGRRVSCMVLRSVSAVMSTSGLWRLTPWKREERKSGLLWMKDRRVSGVRVRGCMGKGTTCGTGGISEEGSGAPPTRGPASSRLVGAGTTGEGEGEGGEAFLEGCGKLPDRDNVVAAARAPREWLLLSGWVGN